MKKLICTILALASLASLSACGKTPTARENNAPPENTASSYEQVSLTEPETEATAAKTTEPAAPEAVPLTNLPTAYGTLDLYLTDMLGQSPIISFTDETTGASRGSIDDYGMLLWDLALHWDRAKEIIPEKEYTCTMRFENPETGWYAELRNGSNANYVYLSEPGIFVPMVNDVEGPTADFVDNALNNISAWVFEETPSYHYYGSVHGFLVKDAVHVRYVDHLGVGHEVILPEIQLNGAEANAANSAIWAAYDSYINETASWYSEINYKWSVNGNILSLVIQSCSDTKMVEAEVYNFSVSSGTRLSNEDVYAVTGMEDLRTRVSHAIACYTGEELLHTAKGNEADFVFSGGTENTFTVDLFNWGIAQENYEAATPYINEQGQLCVIANIYQLAGAASHSGDVCVEHYDTEVLYSGKEYYLYYENLYQNG